MSTIEWPIIGVDESGKGDFFGPLVIAGVLVDEPRVEQLKEWRVRDSKLISNGKVTTLAERIKGLCVHDVIVINPAKYNELYARIRNLNKLLGWGHARVIENVLSRGTAQTAISDKFGADRFILDNLQAEGRKIELVQMVRGEAHIAVAAASIVARAEFLRRMDQLSGSYAIDFPRGASARVDEAGRQLIRARGNKVLTQVAKVHFKNYKKIL